MSELKSILLAIELATSQRDALAQVQARTQQELDFAVNQLAQLQGYAGDTDKRWLEAGSLMRSVELMRHHYQFSERLQQAIGLQEATLATLGKQLDSDKQAVVQTEFRLAGLNRILAARQAALLRKQKKREQQQTDEFAALLHIRIKTLKLQRDRHGH